MKINEMTNNENGSAMILVLMVLVLLTVIGIAALDFSIVETQISRNDRCYKQNLYRAESAVMEASELFATISDPNKLAQLLPSGGDRNDALHTVAEFDPETGTWDEESNPAAVNAANFTGDDIPQYVISFIGQVDGREDGVDFKRYEYAIYGRSTMCKTRLDVKAGYVARF